MAGIVVSGGTYSGSGDVTTGYFYALGSGASGDVKPTVYFPEGTLTITSENTIDYGGEGYTGYAVNMPREAGLSNSPSVYAGTRGTVRITTAATTKVYLQYLHWGSLAYSGGASCQTIGDYNNANELHVEDGTFWSNGSGIATSGNLKVYDGGVLDLDSNNINPSFGSLEIKTGGIVSGNTDGTITINYDLYNRTDLYSVMYRNNGTFVANGGTLKLKTNQDAVQGGGGGTGNPYNVQVENLGGGAATPYIRVYNTPVIDNDLTISGAVVYNNNLAGGMNHTVSGNVRVVSGASYANTGAAANVQTFGSLTIEDTATFITSPLGTTTLTGEVDDYAFYAKGGSTFTANNGTIKITTPAETQIRNQSDEPWHSLEIDNSNNICDFRYNSNVVHTGDLIVNAGDTLRMTGDLSYSWKWAGTATISGTLDGGYGAGATGLWSFGMMDIASGGEYIATKGTTQITQPSVGAGKFYNLGTFTHNNGLVSLSGASQEQFLGPNNGSMTFYDLELQSNEWTNFDGAGGAVTVTIENSYNSYNANRGMNMTYTNNKLILGSATGACTFSGSLRGYNDDPVRQWYVEGASELYPAIFKRSTNNENEYSIVGNTTGSNGSLGGTTHVKWVDFSDVPLYLNSSSADGDFTLNATSGETIWNLVEIPTATTMNCSGQRVTFGGTMTTAADGLIISGALVEMTGAGNWSEGGYQQYMGRDSASVIWNSTGYYSPNGGYLNTGWRDVLWNASARVNQDGCFRNSNLIVGGQLDANNRNIGTTTRTPKIVIANGGTISSSAGIYYGSSFSNRGGLFASSSAVFTDGVKGVSSQYVQAATFSDLNSATASTMEVWFKVDNTKPMDQAGVISPLGTNRMQITVSSNPVSASGNYRLGFEWENGGTEIWNSGKVQDWDDTKWHHAAMTFDDTDGYKLYFDGKLEASGAALGNSAGSTVIADPTVMVGGQNDYSYINRAFAGTIGRASIWDTALTSAQIRTMLFQDFDTATTTNCVLWWQFDEGEGGTVADKSGQGNTGTLSGTATNTTWADGGTWHAGNILSGSSTNLYIGKGTYSTDFASSYYALENTYLISGAKWTSKAHSGSNDYYIDAGSGTTFNFSQIGNEPQAIVRNAVPPTGGSDVTLIDTEVNGGGNYTFIFDEGENDLGTAKDCKQLVVESGVTFKVTTGVDYYTQDFKNRGTWEHGAAFDGTIHDDGSLPTEYEPIDLKQHISDPPIDAGLAID